MAEEEEVGITDADTSGAAGKIPLNQTRGYYKKNIPFTDDQKAKSNLPA